MNQLFTDVCDLSANLRLKRLVFTTTYHPDCEEIDNASPRMHVLAQILSTISTKICWLDSLEYKIRIPIDHQLRVLEAQVELAIELKRNVSFHSVKAQKATVDFLQKMKDRHGRAWTRIAIDMHSCGLSSDVWREIEVINM